jgi:RHS repeat-associated protein
LPGTIYGGHVINTYDASDERVIRQSYGPTHNTVYVFDTLELRMSDLISGGSPVVSDYTLDKWREVPYLIVNGVRVARVNYAENSPEISGGKAHVFLELGDHLGSTNIVIDHATSELVERGTYQAYGAAESDYRPDRWENFREDYRFTGKEEDVTVGLHYFGKRFLSTHLNRWISADPLTVHALGADLNVYAYVSGRSLKSVDPLGLDEKTLTSEPGNPADENAAKELTASKGNMTPYSPGAAAMSRPTPASRISPGPANAGGRGGASSAVAGAEGQGGSDAPHYPARAKPELARLACGGQNCGNETGPMILAVMPLPKLKLPTYSQAEAGAALRHGFAGATDDLVLRFDGQAANAQVAALREAQLAVVARPRPGAAGALQVGGKTFTAQSVRGGPAPQLHPDVQKVLDAIPRGAQGAAHGKCVEPQCLSQALNAGVDPRGGFSAVTRVRSPNNPKQGTSIEPCKSCGVLLKFFGVGH